MSAQKKRNAIRNSVSAKRWMLSSALTAVSMAAMAVPSQAADPTHSWANLNQDAGSFTTGTETGNVTNIKLNTDRAIGSGNADIYSGHTVNVDGALLAVRDTKSDPTKILGNLNSNGRIVIIDANGVFFGKNSMVDVAGIVATTGNIDNDQLLNNDFGDYVIDGVNSGSIELNGMVNVAEAGLAAFVSPFVTNNGVINAKLGNVVMASGETVTLDLYGDGLLEIAVDGELSDALIENKGTINAEGGKVQITALAAKDAVDNIINMDGIVNVASVTQKGGKIILSGGAKGTVSVSGELNASGETGGGEIAVTGQNIDITEDAILLTDAITNGNGGDITLIAESDMFFKGAAFSRGGALDGKGGFIETSGHEFIDIAGGHVDTTASDGTAGFWLIDPTDITIVFDAPGGSFVPSTNSQVGIIQIAMALSTSNVTIATSGGNTGNGDITFDAPGGTTGYGFGGGSFENRTLEFNADRNIIVTDSVGLGGVGTTNLTAAGDIIFNNSFYTYDSNVNAVTSGNLNITAGDDIFVNTGAHVGITTGSGDLTLSAHNGNGGLSAIEIDGSVMTQGGTLTLNADHYFAEVNATGSVITRNGHLVVNSDHGFDIDQGANVDLGSGNATINAPKVQLGDDIVTTGTITGTASVVDVENNNAQIQDGIDVAASGATVNVAADTYTENLLIDKSVKLSGAPGATLQYDAATGTGNLITVTAADVNIDPFTFDGLGLASNGIFADGANNLIVDGNAFLGFTDNNISINNSATVKIFDNTMTGANTGIFADNAYDIKVYDNFIFNAGATGIHVKNTNGTNDVNDVDIWGNAISSSNNTTTGILVENSDYATIGVTDNNPFASGYAGGNIIIGGVDAIVITNSNHSVARYNTIYSVANTGVNINNSDNASISRNIIDAQTTGVKASSSDDLEIDNNCVTGATGPDGAVLGDGIFVKNSKRMNVNNNTIIGVSDDGIQGNNTDNATVHNNMITNFGDEGVVLITSSNSTVTENTITGGQTGVRAIRSHDIEIANNIIRDQVGGAPVNGSGDAINLDNSDNAVINTNHMSGQSNDGIDIENGSDNAMIVFNSIKSVGDDGIDVKNSDNAIILWNKIKRSGDNGIEVNGGRNVQIGDNSIKFAGNNGIDIENSGNATIILNRIRRSNNNGIKVENGGRKILIGGNEVIRNGDNGIEVSLGSNVLVWGNDAIKNGGNGIDVTNNWGDVLIYSNFAGGNHNNGIYVNGAPHVEIAGNHAHRNWANGIYATNINSPKTLYVDNNTTHDNGEDGIKAFDLNTAYITNNTSYNNGDDGIDINSAYHVEIRDNDIYGNGYGLSMPSAKSSYDGDYEGRTKGDYYQENGNGIEVKNIYGGNTLIIDDNNIFANATNGIEVSSSDSTLILNNNIYDNGAHGLAMLGWNNGDVVVAGNDFIDNPIGALFESGYIDISNLLEPNTFTNTDPAATPVGMVFDKSHANYADSEGSEGAKGSAPTTGQLSLVGNTLGTTKFTGFQNEGSFYVRVEDGTLLDGSGAPIVIDGINAMFDGIKPSATGRILEATALNFIEDRLYDADDSPINSRGQIFVGKELVELNIEDFLNQLFGFNPGSGRLNITIAGLPAVRPLRAGAPNPAALNLITPAAGGDKKDQTADELANIEPEAGGEKASCWSDAINVASSGATVNYGFGGSFEKTLADASACSVTGL